MTVASLQRISHKTRRYVSIQKIYKKFFEKAMNYVIGEDDARKRQHEWISRPQTIGRKSVHPIKKTKTATFLRSNIADLTI